MAVQPSNGNIGAAIGALLPMVVGGAVLLRTPMAPGTLQITPLAPAAVAPAPAPVMPAASPAPMGALSPAPPGNATPQCLSRYTIDLPQQRGDAAAGRETVICRRGYVLAFNVDTRDPDWSMEHLTAADLTGPAVRSNGFGHDPALPAGADATDGDYLRSNFDRGHQSPAGDAKFAQQVMDQSFYFSNMAPQVGIGFNRGVWKFLEETVRDWVVCGGHPDIHVITGPIYGPRPGAIGADHVTVPVAFFKIVYDDNDGRAVGFVLPNQKIGARIADLQTYVKPIAWIETETGLNFFRSFDQRRQSQLKDTPGTAWAHVATCPGTGSTLGAETAVREGA